MQYRMLALAALAGLVVGCVDQPSPAYRVSGTFTENATQERMDELAGEVDQRGGDFAQMESFPVQFRATDLGATACEEVASFAEDAEYVAEVGDCKIADGSGG